MTWRTRLGIVLLVLFSLFQSFRALEYYDPSAVWKRAQKGKLVPSDFLTIYKKNVSCVLSELPAGETVGFVTSVPNKKQQRDAIYHMTQFAIVPFLLEDSLEHDFVIAYYPNRIKPKPDIPSSFTLQKQCTDEVFLLRKAPQ